ncbi:MAG: hypothetical protein M1480_16065 [Bacteroidetes bacterium]|nr:hypothetical protein [Bacteroidota bacterium]
MMETIFDHNVTGVEIELLNSFMSSRAIRDKEKYEQNIDRDRSYSDLYHLYTLRGEIRKAEQYLSKIKDPEYKNILSVF